MLSIWQFYSWTFSLENETISVKFTSDCWCIWENFCGIHISSLSVEYTFPSLRKQPSFFAPSPSGVSREMPLGPGAEKDGCFRRALHVSSLSTYQFTALISSDLQWLAKLVLVVQLWSLHKISDQKKNVCRRWVVNYGRCVASWLLHLSLNVKQSGFKPWLGTLCCVLGQRFTLSVPLSQSRCINGYWLT